MVRETGGLGHSFHIKEGVTQGGTLSMIEYGIGIILIIYELHSTHPQVTQYWHDNDAVARGHFADFRAHL